MVCLIHYTLLLLLCCYWVKKLKDFTTLTVLEPTCWLEEQIWLFSRCRPYGHVFPIRSISIICTYIVSNISLNMHGQCTC